MRSFKGTPVGRSVGRPGGCFSARLAHRPPVRPARFLAEPPCPSRNQHDLPAWAAHIGRLYGGGNARSAFRRPLQTVYPYDPAGRPIHPAFTFALSRKPRPIIFPDRPGSDRVLPDTAGRRRNASLEAAGSLTISKRSLKRASSTGPPEACRSDAGE